MSVTPRPDIALPEREALEQVFRLKYGDPPPGWAPQLRRRFGYFTPDDVYEALVAALVTPGCHWLDVGCGRDLFPSNRPLAKLLAERVGSLVGVDPAPTLTENPFVHERHACLIDDFVSGPRFDVLTLRMVAEHVERPERVVAALAAAARPGGVVVIYTPFRWAPVPILTAIVPFALHQPVKRWLWRTEKKDTFPTRFRMNTRQALRTAFDRGGFQEVLFAHADDCRTFGRFRPLLWAELTARAGLRKLGLRYPETCILAVYRRL